MQWEIEKIELGPENILTWLEAGGEVDVELISRQYQDDRRHQSV